MLVVLADDETTARRCFANLPNAQTTSFGQLSAHDVLRSDWILFSDRTLPGAGGAVPETTVETTTEEETESGEATTDA